ncbi:hypothetical protein AXG94_04880 [Pseudomonas corrugata]|nr:hypothetical protein AXG94_04880 [Pseudomonas corrugata]
MVILFTFALGTAAGDWVAGNMEIGSTNAAWLFGGLIAITAVAHYLVKGSQPLRIKPERARAFRTGRASAVGTRVRGEL